MWYIIFIIYKIYAKRTIKQNMYNLQNFPGVNLEIFQKRGWAIVYYKRSEHRDVFNDSYLR